MSTWRTNLITWSGDASKIWTDLIREPEAQHDASICVSILGGIPETAIADALRAE